MTCPFNESFHIAAIYIRFRFNSILDQNINAASGRLQFGLDFLHDLTKFKTVMHIAVIFSMHSRSDVLWCHLVGQ